MARVRRASLAVHRRRAKLGGHAARASRLYERIANLAGGLSGAEYAPTKGQRDLAASIQMDLAQAIAADDALFGARLQALDTMLRRDHLSPISVTR